MYCIFTYIEMVSGINWRHLYIYSVHVVHGLLGNVEYLSELNQGGYISQAQNISVVTQRLLQWHVKTVQMLQVSGCAPGCFRLGDVQRHLVWYETQTHYLFCGPRPYLFRLLK